MQFATMYMAVWCGSSMLRLPVLDDFVNFVLNVYSSPSAIELLERKRRDAPYVTDMALWYLFVARSERAAEWHADLRGFPKTKRWRFCDGQAAGFDHMHGHKRSPLGLSVHFQGETKGDIRGFLASHSK